MMKCHHEDGMDDEAAIQWVRGTIRAEMTRRGLTYADVVKRLRAAGIEEGEKNLANKVARGTFSAVFFVQCLEAIGVTEIRLDMLAMARSLDRVVEEMRKDGPLNLGPKEMAEAERFAAERQARFDAEEKARQGKGERRE
jgi:hypothetical protein